ncbi:hypothetical protein NKG05_28590 [Oerskovia sp. M15]
MPVLDTLTHALTVLVHPLQWVVAWILVHLHGGLSALGLDPAGGAAWSLAIVGLVVIVKLLLVPLVVTQVRGCAPCAPLARDPADPGEVPGKTDAASRQAARREQQELVQRTGANPLRAACLCSSRPRSCSPSTPCSRVSAGRRRSVR